MSPDRPPCDRCGTLPPGGVPHQFFGYHSGEVKLVCRPCGRMLEEAEGVGRVLPRHLIFAHGADLLRKAASLVATYRSPGGASRMPRAVEELRRAASLCGMPPGWSRYSLEKVAAALQPEDPGGGEAVA